MSYTNSTPNYELPQWIGTDKPTFLGDFNSAFSAIDTAMKNNEDSATAAVGTANAASATAQSANTNANTALNTANTAKDSADAATAAAASATSTANTAQTTAQSAARTAQANNIANLAPAYDPTLTYNVDDLVTYVDDQNSGKLYKCIIAVNTPMEFNVNYWDDVTTSDVYEDKTRLLSSFSVNTSMSWADVLTQLRQILNQHFGTTPYDVKKLTKLSFMLMYDTGASYRWIFANSGADGLITLTRVGSVSLPGEYFTVDEIVVSGIGNATNNFKAEARVNNGTTGVTFTDRTATNLGHNGTFYVYG